MHLKYCWEAKGEAGSALLLSEWREWRDWGKGKGSCLSCGVMAALLQPPHDGCGEGRLQSCPSSIGALVFDPPQDLRLDEFMTPVLSVSLIPGRKTLPSIIHTVLERIVSLNHQLQLCCSICLWRCVVFLHKSLRLKLWRHGLVSGTKVFRRYSDVPIVLLPAEKGTFSLRLNGEKPAPPTHVAAHCLSSGWNRVLHFS